MMKIFKNFHKALPDEKLPFIIALIISAVTVALSVMAGVWVGMAVLIVDAAMLVMLPKSDDTLPMTVLWVMLCVPILTLLMLIIYAIVLLFQYVIFFIL